MQRLVLNGGSFSPAGVRIASTEHPPPFGGSGRAQRCTSLRSPSSGATAAATVLKVTIFSRKDGSWAVQGGGVVRQFVLSVSLPCFSGVAWQVTDGTIVASVITSPRSPPRLGNGGSKLVNGGVGRRGLAIQGSTMELPFLTLLFSTSVGRRQQRSRQRHPRRREPAEQSNRCPSLFLGGASSMAIGGDDGIMAGDLHGSNKVYPVSDVLVFSWCAAAMAPGEASRQRLGITVASEATFSACTRVLDRYRAKLSSDMVQVLICGADWVRQLHGINKPIMTHEEEEPVDVIIRVFGVDDQA
nr:zinc finger BED domain-containing protein RICESLEEPER 2-like [Ipomoea batatas]